MSQARPVGLSADEERDLRRLVRRFLGTESSTDEVRRLMETPTGHDPDVWDRLGDLGVKTIAVPEAYGGAGGGFSDLRVVLEELGRSLYGGPFLSTVCMAVPAILNAGDARDCELFLPRLVSAGGIGAVALHDQRDQPTSAVQKGSRTHLSGTKTFVIDGHIADLLVTSAQEPHDPGSTALFVVERDSPGVDVELIPTLDQTRKLATVVLDDAPASRLRGADNGHEAVARTLSQAAICLASEMIGGAERCLEMSVEHAKTRHQFGRPIGSFQAVKHRCADMFISLELARSVSMDAMRRAGSTVQDLSIVASHAKAYCSRAYVWIAEQTLQVHGGIGFTWEHDAHLYLKRAKSSQFLLGDDFHHRSSLAAALGL